MMALHHSGPKGAKRSLNVRSMEWLDHSEQLLVDVVDRREAAECALGHDTQVHSLCFEAIFVPLSVLCRLATAKALRWLARFRPAEIQVRPQLHCLFCEVDSEHAGTGLTSKFKVDLLARSFATNDGRLNLDVTNDPICLGNGVISRFIYFGPRNLERTLVLQPRELQQLA